MLQIHGFDRGAFSKKGLYITYKLKEPHDLLYNRDQVIGEIVKICSVPTFKIAGLAERILELAPELQHKDLLEALRTLSRVEDPLLVVEVVASVNRNKFFSFYFAKLIHCIAVFGKTKELLQAYAILLSYFKEPSHIDYDPMQRLHERLVKQLKTP